MYNCTSIMIWNCTPVVIIMLYIHIWKQQTYHSLLSSFQVQSGYWLKKIDFGKKDPNKRKLETVSFRWLMILFSSEGARFFDNIGQRWIFLNFIHFCSILNWNKSYRSQWRVFLTFNTTTTTEEFRRKSLHNVLKHRDWQEACIEISLIDFSA